MDDNEACWYELHTGGIINEEILLDEFLGVNKDVIVDDYPTSDEILYLVKKEMKTT